MIQKIQFTCNKLRESLQKHYNKLILQYQYGCHVQRWIASDRVKGYYLKAAYNYCTEDGRYREAII